MPTKSRVVLLAEDDPADQLILRRAMSASPVQSTLYVVGDGAEVFEYMEHRGRYADPADAPRPDLLIVDLNMPKVDGREVIRRLRADDRFRSLPIVALTTSDDRRDIEECYRLGVNSYVVKPFGLGALRETVESLQRYWFELVELPRSA